MILGDPSSLIHLSFDDNDRNTVDLSLFDPSDPIMPRKFFDVDLQQSPSNRLGTISPQSCMNCHRPAGNDLPKKPRGSGRLNVEPFYVWDQWQGSLNDGFHNDQQHLPDDFVRRDREFTRIFTEAYNNGSLSETVYGQLPALPTRIAADLDRFSNRDSRNPRANLESLRLISRLNARKIATELINSPNYQSLKNIVLYLSLIHI